MENEKNKVKIVFKKLTAILMVVVLLLCAVPLESVEKISLTLGVEALNDDFAGGSGTKEAPYLIETTQQLNLVRNHLNAHFKLICDIEFSDADFGKGGTFYNDSMGWSPIGNFGNSFTGVFDGNGHSIKNLYIKNANEKFVGLFGCNEGTIKNLSVINAYVRARGDVGGGIFSTTVYVGTIAGYSIGSILNCCSFGKVYAFAENPGTPTSESYYKAYVYAGGIVGFNGGSTGIVENCYNNSSVTSKSSFQPDPYAGGIAGESNGSIRTSYNVGDISSYYCGGIVGKNGNSSSADCYYLDNVSKGVGSGADVFTKCTLSSMYKEDTFNEFDFTNVWTFDSRYGYLFPVLQNGYIPNLINTVDFVGGCGTEISPYLIETKEHLNNIRKFPNACYKMISDIVFTMNDFSSNGDFYNNGKGWNPIGTKEEPFSGCFDGNGYTIKGLYINITSPSVIYAGLFGVDTGMIKNLGMIDCNINVKNNASSAAMAGSIAGSGENIINCYNTGNIIVVSPNIAYAGGIVGTGSDIENCYNIGNISAIASTSNYSETTCSAYAGGILGRGGYVSACYNTGNIAASAQSVYYNVPTKTNTGGIAGQGWDIYNSFNVGYISSTTSSEANTGGVCGLSGNVSNCYNAGNISSNSTSIGAYTTLYTGGIAGNVYSGIITNCYYLDSINKGIGFGTDLCTKCISCEMLKQTTYAEFDFDIVWTINKNGDYPLPTLKDVNQTIILSDNIEIGHTSSDWIIDKQSTCKEEGIKHRECIKCKEPIETAEITKIKHSEVKVLAKVATCTETGLTEGKKCSACGEITVKQEEISIVSHKDENNDCKCDFGCGYEFEKPTEPTTQPTTVPTTATTTKPAETTTAKPVETTKPSETTTTAVITEPTTVTPTEPTTAPTTAVPTTTQPTTAAPTTQPTTEPTTQTPTTKPVEEPTTAPTTTVHTHTEVVLPAVAATYTKDGLTEGKKCSSCGEILEEQKTVSRKKLSKVKSLKVKSTKTTSVKLSWKKVEGAESYKVYYSTNGKKWKSIKATKNSVTVKKLTSGTSYQFKVKAVAGKYEGSASSVVKTATKVSAPAVKSVKSSKAKQAVVTWKKVNGANGYVIEYSTSKKFNKKTTKSVTVKKGKTVKTTLKKLKSGKKYYVRIKAYKTVNKKAVYGAYSKAKTVKVK